MESFIFTVKILFGMMMLAPFVVSTLLFIWAINDLMAACEKQSRRIEQKLKIGSVSAGAIIISLFAAILGLYWKQSIATDMSSLISNTLMFCLLASFTFMTVFTWIILPLGLCRRPTKRKNNKYNKNNKKMPRLKEEFRELYLFFAAASIPLAAVSFGLFAHILVGSAIL